MFKDKKVFLLVLVAALGYFVDIYDLLLFSIVRKASLISLNVPAEELLNTGAFLLNMQMGGMLIGGLLWGILGDKKGRVSVLFGSIIMYSLANIANGFVNDVPTYAALRFIAGIGLAGELGAGITLVSEVMSKESRGYGTMVVATIGVLGAVAANLIGQLTDWRQSYFIGGGLGLLILVLRFGVFESGMYKNIEKEKIDKGTFLKILTNKNLLFTYINCILIGLPLWYVVGILITFSPEFGKEFGLGSSIAAGKSVMYTYIGLAIGDFLSGWLSQKFRSRKKVIFGFLIGVLVTIIIYLFFNQYSADFFYFVCLLMGIAVGYWALFVTNASEQFGTNIRSTVTTTVPNFVRGSVIPLTISFQFISTINISGKNIGIIYSALVLGIITIVISFLSLRKLKETFGKDLNYTDIF
ncbi:MFS transporter [soil metagenome]